MASSEENVESGRIVFPGTFSPIFPSESAFVSAEYGAVGAAWQWVDRRDWSMERWRAWVDRPEHELWTCWMGGAPAGYVELEAQADGAVEVAYFGLLERFQGRGIGGWLLAAGLTRAWQREGTRRVWLHTCSLDGPQALPNYEARGLVRCGEYTEWRLV